ncbi:NADH-dependent flavin oxidoreductase [Desulfosarcina ovata subsp. sediminis]|uniref:NADH-dependent flavin oxidoreductase n=1 Tax=Desulfosarcina ovata subsp. sediminis TaxID=885957 RepID=A0A5K7ZJM0_9BACT|nr:NADH-dependent flavin oxidoreductase [Desulfosarcina ovata subsp. sediminis]
MIITGHAFVRRDGQAAPWQLAIDSDHLIDDLRKMTDAVHHAGGKIFMQLSHAGNRADTDLTGVEAIGPSVQRNAKGIECRAMSDGDIEEIIESFGKGAVRAKWAGFDGVQIHAGHGYLLSQFLSPLHNLRNDHHGGKIENRARIVLDVYHSIRNDTGDAFPVIIKINSQDHAIGEFGVNDMLDLATLLQAAGIDAIELSGDRHHLNRSISTSEVMASTGKEVYYARQAKSYKEKISTPLILVGGIRSFHIAKQIVNDGVADYVSLCRPLIREPALINRWESGDTRKAACISDNRCIKPALQGSGLYCVAEKKKEINLVT